MNEFISVILFKQTPIVLGFHNSSSTENFESSPYLWFEKFFQRMMHKTGLQIYDWLSLLADQTSVRTESILYGHSLNSTDSDFIQRIFNVSSVVKIYYHDEVNLPALISNLIRLFGKEQVEQDYNSKKIIFLPCNNRS